MKLIRQHEFGPASALRYGEAPDLSPAAGQVRVAVAASGVHLIDTVIRQGIQMGLFALPALPMTPGREVAGAVDAVGDGVDPSWLGRRVVAHLGQANGGYASQAVADVTSLHPIPDGASFEAAVTMIGTGRTAMGILRIARLEPTDVVLVTSAAGGLGALLLQAAHNAGAATIAAAGGPAKLGRVEATYKADYLDPQWASRWETKPTVVLDGVGGEIGRAALKALAPGGRLVMFGYSSGALTPLSAADIFEGSVSVHVALGPSLAKGGLRGLEEESMAQLAAGRFTPLVTGFALADAAKAHEALETRATVGKTVLFP